MRKATEIRKRVEEAILAAGGCVVAHRFAGSGLQRLDFVVAGAMGHFVFAKSPSPNPRAILNAVAAAKRTVRRTADGQHV